MKKLTVALIAVFLFPASFALGGEHPAPFPLGDPAPNPAVSELEFAFHTTPEFAHPLDEYQMDETEGQRGRRVISEIIVIAAKVTARWAARNFYNHYFVENPHAGSDFWELGYGGGGGYIGGYPLYGVRDGVRQVNRDVNQVDRFLHELGGTDEIPPNGIIR